MQSAQPTIGSVGWLPMIQREFSRAYASPFSVILLDDLERLIEYVPIGPRFSSAILQTLITLVRAPPPTGSKLLTGHGLGFLSSICHAPR